MEGSHPAMLGGVMVPIYSNPAMKKEVYFVGIIDPLSRYKLRKKVAHFLKEIIWDADTLSTVPAPPSPSRRRRIPLIQVVVRAGARRLLR